MNLSHPSTLQLEDLRNWLSGSLREPNRLFGPTVSRYRGQKRVQVRAYLPEATQAWLQDPSGVAQISMKKVHPGGLFEGDCYWVDPDQLSGWLESRAREDSGTRNPEEVPYKIVSQNAAGHRKTVMDSYAISPLLSDFDLHLFHEGKHYRIYDKLGAHIRRVDGQVGVNFAVWAPNAQSVSVVGNFNSWDRLVHPMKPAEGSNGVWELFVPNITDGEIYKYSIKESSGQIGERSDPYGFSAEIPPATASKVCDLSQYQWNDDSWMEQRAEFDSGKRPVSVYEVHLGSWQTDSQRTNGWMNYRELAHRLVKYCKDNHFTHLELMPISEHPFTGSWGYQTVGYFSTTSRYGSPEDFMYFVDHCHQNGIGVIIDWVPAHFPKDRHGLARFDGTALYEHEDPRQGEHPDWGTLIFNYGRQEIKNFLVANALFWLDKFHIDGLRVDAVASMLYLDYSREPGQWVPNVHGGRENLEAVEFLKEFNGAVKTYHPGVMTIAEESTSWEGVTHSTDSGGLGFDIKWNMGWMNDTLRYFQNDPIHRSHHHGGITFSLVYAFHERFALPFSHDEVVHGKGSLLDQMPGDRWQKFANLRSLFCYMWAHPGKKLNFMGNEFAMPREWNHDRSLDWHLLEEKEHLGIQNLVKDLNKLYVKYPELHAGDYHSDGFQWVEVDNHQQSILSFLRKCPDSDKQILVVLNLTPNVHCDFIMGVPDSGDYHVLLNTDSEFYGGTNFGKDQYQSIPQESHGFEHRVLLDLPPLGGLILRNENQGS